MSVDMHDTAHEIDEDFESSFTSYDHGLEVSPPSLLDSDSSDIISDCTKPLTLQTLLSECKPAQHEKKLCRQSSWQEIRVTIPKLPPRLRRHNSENVLFSLKLDYRKVVSDHRHAQTISEQVEHSHPYYRGLYYSELVKSAMLNGRLLRNPLAEDRPHLNHAHCGLGILSQSVDKFRQAAIETDRTQPLYKPTTPEQKQRNSIESDEEEEIVFRKYTPDSLGHLESLSHMYENSTYHSVFERYALETERAADREAAFASDLGEPNLTRMEKKLVMKKQPLVRRDTNLFLLAPPDFKINPD